MGRKRLLAACNDGQETATENDSKPNKGGPPTGNVNGLKHGAYSDLEKRAQDKLGRRRQLYRLKRLLAARDHVQGELTSALGGDLSPQDGLLVDRVANLAVRIALLEVESLQALADNPEVRPPNDERLLAWINTLRLCLCALGLERRAKPVESLQDYLKKRDAESKAQSTPEDTQK